MPICHFNGALLSAERPLHEVVKALFACVGALLQLGVAPQKLQGFAPLSMFPTIGYWLAVKDGDPRAYDLFSRHYSYHDYADRRRQLHGYRNRFLIMGPGEKLVLLGADERALFGWRRYHDASQGYCVSCTVFRNEGSQRSSDLIREASQLARERWPGERLVTYVDPRAVQSHNPGYCFLMAGWRKCGITKWNKLIILELTDGGH